MYDDSSMPLSYFASKCSPVIRLVALLCIPGFDPAS